MPHSPIIDAPTAIAGHEEGHLTFLDASWYLPAEPRDPSKEFLNARIPGARRFDFDGEFAETMSALPHMLPSSAEFTQRAQALGLNENDSIVVYDTAGLFAAPRAWWMLRAMGHDQVCVLDGGFPAWRAAGGPVASGPPEPARPGNFTARPEPSRLMDAKILLSGLPTGRHHIIDARPAARFAGTAPEPRPGLRSGHIPGAVNLPFDQLVDDGKLADLAKVRAKFDGATDAAALVMTCGSGVTAAILAWSYEVAFGRPAAVYDGSWAEWGSNDGLPIETGPSEVS
jgi:thiosulfate/3-mercaptopyruvate sulfurtransferase